MYSGDNIVTTTLPTPCTVLELGAGTGLVSLALAASGLAANFVVTDLPSMVNFVEQNIQRNAAVLKRAGGVLSICAEGLRWANEVCMASSITRRVVLGHKTLFIGNTTSMLPSPGGHCDAEKKAWRDI